MILVQLLLCAKLVQQVVYALYVWQLKEYRSDRFREHLVRKHGSVFNGVLAIGLFSLPNSKKLPRLTIKASLIFLLSATISYILLFSHFGLIIPLLLLSPGLVWCSILIFKPLEYAIRYCIYTLASMKVSRHANRGLVVVGITGSYGKTTTKRWLETVLSPSLHIFSIQEGFNTPLSVSMEILKHLSSNHECMIVEMGAYKKGEISQLCSIARPTISVTTGIGTQHLSLFGSQENLISAKSELIANTATGGLALINKQSRFQPNIDDKHDRHYKYYDHSDVEKYTQALMAAGIPDYLHINLAPALIIAKHLKIPDASVKKALSDISLPKGRGEMVIGRQQALIIDSSYNSNVESIFASLAFLDRTPRKPKIVILSPLIELGETAKDTHKRIGKITTGIGAHVIVTSDDYENELKSTYAGPGMIFCQSDNEVVKTLTPLVTNESVILIQGRVSSKIVQFCKTRR